MPLFGLFQMDVKLVAPSVPYLDKGNVQLYSGLKFYSNSYEVVKMNPLMLAALRCPVAMAIITDDTEDCSVITEFSLSELQEVNSFSMTGHCNMDLAKSAFHSLGNRLIHNLFHICLNTGASKALEPRQYKNDSIQSTIIPILKLARFFPYCLGGEKERQFQSWNYF